MHVTYEPHPAEELKSTSPAENLQGLSSWLLIKSCCWCTVCCDCQLEICAVSFLFFYMWRDLDLKHNIKEWHLSQRGQSLQHLMQHKHSCRPLSHKGIIVPQALWFWCCGRKRIELSLWWNTVIAQYPQPLGNIQLAFFFKGRSLLDIYLYI